jgi:galactokinase
VSGSLTWFPAWQPGEGAARATALFAEAFGGAPAGVWSAPGRVNLIGEHTDYAGGLCLPVALPHRTYVALRPRDDGRVRLVSAQEPQGWSGALADVAPGAVTGWAGYAVGVAWAMAEGLRAEGVAVPGFDAAVDSCVPLGAGLSSSAALECAVAVALDELTGAGLAADDAGRARLAGLCVRAENEIAGAPTGGLDQSAALRCAPDHALLVDFGAGGAARQVDAALGDRALLVIDTRAPHRLVDGQYGARRASCVRAAEILGVPALGTLTSLDGVEERLRAAGDEDAETLVRRVRHVVTENARVREVVALLAAGRPADVGPVLTAGHASLRDDYEVTCPELDLTADTATASGALGARMVGGGFGGSVLALVPRAQAESVAAAVADAFARAGFTAPAFLVAEPSGPADRTCTVEGTHA